MLAEYFYGPRKDENENIIDEPYSAANPPPDVSDFRNRLRFTDEEDLDEAAQKFFDWLHESVERDGEQRFRWSDFRRSRARVRLGAGGDGGDGGGDGGDGGGAGGDGGVGDGGATGDRTVGTSDPFPDKELLVNEIMTELFSKDWQQTLNEEGAHAESANLLYRSFNALTPKDLVSEHKKLVVDKHVSRRTSGEKPPLGADEKAELLNNIKESFKIAYRTDPPDSWLTYLAPLNDATLQSEYEKIAKVIAEQKGKQGQAIYASQANNLSRFDPLMQQEGVMWPNILARGRALAHHEFEYLPYMEKEGKDKLKALKDEVKSLASQGGIDWDDIEKQERQEAQDNQMEYGSSDWFGSVHDKAQEQLAKLREYSEFTESNGGDLRANVNYKPWLGIQYDDQGNGRFIHLTENRLMEPEELAFEDGEHIIYNAEDGEGRNAREEFFNKLDPRTLRPLDGDQIEDIATFGDTQENPSFINGIYHPESGAWINPHRYNEIGTDDSDFLITSGGQFHGNNTGQSQDPRFAFSKLSAAKQKGVGSDLGFLVDSQGNIHANSWNAQTFRDPTKAQSVNDVIHDWYSQQIAARQQSFLNDQGQMQTSAVIPSALERQLGGRIKRRGIRENIPDWNLFGKWGPTLTRRQLTPEEAGVERWKDQYKPLGRPALYPIPLPQEFRQKWMDVVDWPQLGFISWLAKLPIGGTNQMDRVIREHRRQFNLTIKNESEVANRRRALGKFYITPGEERARRTDYKQLGDYLGNQQRAAARAGDKAAQNKYLEQIDQLKGLNILDDNQWNSINQMYVGHFPSQQSDQTEDRAVTGIAQMPTQNQGAKMGSTSIPQVGFTGLLGSQEPQTQPEKPIQPLISAGEPTQSGEDAPPQTEFRGLL